MKKIRINVTKRDIENWIFKSPSTDSDRACDNCAVTKAIRRHKELRKAITLLTYITIPDTEPYSERLFLPTKVVRFIRTIDTARYNRLRNHPSETLIIPDPISFTLEVFDGI